ncbi:MAG: ABC transporter substrate-binding protein [Alphaproteobacteria bacterium]|nr:ABC transporter substrate-binding protein [Alphaproteobacteria bacterium]
MRSAAFLALCLASAMALPAAAAPKDRVVLGMVLEPPHLDPTQSPAAAIKEILYANVMEGLTRIDENGAVQPLLATEWSTAPDGLSYTFKLRPGVNFQDGTPFTAESVKFNLERNAAPSSVNVLKRALYSNIAAVETPDPTTVTIRLAALDYLLPWQLAQGEAVLFSPKTAAEAKSDPIGTGPFAFVSWSKGSSIDLARFKGYREPDRTGIATVSFRFIADPAAIVASLLSGDVDAFPNGVPPENLPQFQADPRFTVKIGLTEGKTILAINNGKKPFDDLRVRRAIAHAIDRKALVDGVEFGYGVPIGSHFSTLDPNYVDLTAMYPYDPAKAKALLAEAGLAGGFTASLKLPPPSYARRSGEIIAQELAAVGITTSIEPVQFPQWLTNVFTNKAYDLTIISHTEPLDIDIYARPEYYFNYRNPHFDAVIDKIPTVPDAAARGALYKEAQRILAEDCVNAFLFQLPKLGVWKKELLGLWANEPVQANDLTQVRWVP